MKKITIDDKLGIDKFYVNEEHAHIVIDKESNNLEEKEKLVKVCPAGLYKLDEDNKMTFDYIGCLECGACRVLSLGNIVTKWQYPEGTFGVEFRQG